MPGPFIDILDLIADGQAPERSGNSLTGRNFVTTDDAIDASDASIAAVVGNPSATQSALNERYGTALGVDGSASRGPVFEYVGEVFAVADSALASLYWPWWFHAERYLSAPLAPWYCYYSTDHDPGAGGLAVALADSPGGTLTDHGLIYQDTTSGDETETPSVIWDEVNAQPLVFYQQANPSGSTAGQATLLATADAVDGTTLTRVGIAIEPRTATLFPGGQHTGYFRPHRLGSAWYGYHLIAATEYHAFGIAFSPDGTTWEIDPQIMGHSTDVVPAGLHISWNTSTIVTWRGVDWWIGQVDDFTAGGPGTKVAYIGMAPISPDRRNLIAPPTLIDHAEINGVDIRGVHAVVHEARIYITTCVDNVFHTYRSEAT